MKLSCVRKVRDHGPRDVGRAAEERVPRGDESKSQEHRRVVQDSGEVRPDLDAAARRREDVARRSRGGVLARGDDQRERVVERQKQLPLQDQVGMSERNDSVQLSELEESGKSVPIRSESVVELSHVDGDRRSIVREPGSGSDRSRAETVAYGRRVEVNVAEGDPQALVCRYRGERQSARRRQ